MSDCDVIKVIPRRPYDGRLPGFMESDREFVNNNFDAAVALLEREVERARRNG